MKLRYISSTIFSIIIMSVFSISASAFDSWVDFNYTNLWHFEENIYNSFDNGINPVTVNNFYYITPNRDNSAPTIQFSTYPNNVQGCIILYNAADKSYTKIAITNRNPGDIIFIINRENGWFSFSGINSRPTNIYGNAVEGVYYAQNIPSGVGIPASDWWFNFSSIIYSDYKLSYDNSGATIALEPTPISDYFNSLQSDISVNSSGILGQIRRNVSSADIDDLDIYFRTVVIDSTFDPPLIGYTLGKSLAELNITPTNLFEPNYKSIYNANQFSSFVEFPLIYNDFSGMYRITPYSMPVINAYMQGKLKYDKSYTCLLLVSSEWNTDFTNWKILNSQSFNYSAGTIIDLGQNITPPADDNNGGVDLGATPPEHNWGVDGSDVVVPEIDFTSPEYKNPFDVSFLFFYPENGENKPTFYLQYCLISIAICAVAYLLFGKS